MAKPNEPFRVIEAESFYDEAEKKVRVRPCPDGIYPTSLHVECPREMRDTKRYPLGTRFLIRVKLTDREGSKDFLYSYHAWPYEVL
ncbi:hypothetical protein JHL21_11350 [Devosia sp. WQ 349]|uniref:hypothetical protein n=1 Tax=Devosia sp. WQ 349K1 TaxID=2800329 RepID=UPI0019053E49|nr:hypothetical protein [Devosia sp. WQ 349K1]MBK1795094.1 hypothetical protein [Devosia sp. WQ 349K1]